jgi:hypothetical protein
MKSNSKQLTSAIIATLFFAVALLVYFEMIVPNYANLQTDKGQVLSEQALYTNESSTVNQVEKLLITYQSETSSTQLVNMSLPVGQSVASALAQMYGLATNSGFTLQSAGIAIQAVQAPVTAVSTNINSVAAQGGSIVRPTGTVTFQLGGSGTYESLKSFLLGLESNIRLFNVTGISIQEPGQTKGSSPDLFNYTITVVAYYQSS